MGRISRAIVVAEVELIYIYMLLNSCRGLVCTVARIYCNFEAGTMFKSGENKRLV